MTIFLIGPTAGYLDANRKAFVQVAGTLRKEHKADVIIQPDAHRGSALKVADVVVAMEGWRQDPMSRLLASVAELMEVPIYLYPEMAAIEDVGSLLESGT